MSGLQLWASCAHASSSKTGFLAVQPADFQRAGSLIHSTQLQGRCWANWGVSAAGLWSSHWRVHLLKGSPMLVEPKHPSCSLQSYTVWSLTLLPASSHTRLAIVQSWEGPYHAGLCLRASACAMWKYSFPLFTWLAGNNPQV